MGLLLNFANILVMRRRQVAGVLNFYWLRFLYGCLFSAKGLSLICFQSKIDISKYGKIIFHGKVSTYPGSRLAASGKLEIGNNFTLNSYSRVIAYESIFIGDNVTIAQFVSILDHDHRSFVRRLDSDKELVFEGYNCKPIFIGSNVWIADKVSILKGVKIGSNVIIGANSVVTSDIPDFSIAVGVPAKVVKQL